MKNLFSTQVFNLCPIKKREVENWGKVKAKKVKETYFKGKLHL